MFGAVLGRKQRSGSLLKQHLRIVAKQITQHAIDLRYTSALRINQHHAYGRMFEGASESRFTVFKCPSCALQLAHVFDQRYGARLAVDLGDRGRDKGRHCAIVYLQIDLDIGEFSAFRVTAGELGRGHEAIKVKGRLQLHDGATDYVFGATLKQLREAFVYVDDNAVGQTHDGHCVW